MKYDIFISYRRSDGEYTAKIVRDRLENMGYRVFFDVEALRSGDFNTKLYSVIDECRDFILILSPDALDRCRNVDDWVRREVEYALEKKKNIVPIMLRGFCFPDILPASLEPLRYKNGLEANTQFFDAFIQKLQQFLVTKRSFWQLLVRDSTFRRKILITLAAFVLIVILFLYVIKVNPINSTYENQTIIGEVQNNTYINRALGAKAYWNDNSWQVQSQSEIAEIQQIALGTNEELMEWLQDGNSFFDLMVIANDGSANLNIVVSAYDVFETAQASIEDMVDEMEKEYFSYFNEAYTMIGYTDINVERCSVNFINSEYDGFYISAKNVDDIPMFQKICFIMRNEYTFTITATTFQADFTDSLFSKFQKIE